MQAYIKVYEHVAKRGAPNTGTVWNQAVSSLEHTLLALSHHIIADASAHLPPSSLEHAYFAKYSSTNSPLPRLLAPTMNASKVIVYVHLH